MCSLHCHNRAKFQCICMVRAEIHSKVCTEHSGSTSGVLGKADWNILLQQLELLRESKGTLKAR